MELPGWQSPRISLSYSLNSNNNSDGSSPSKNHRPCASPEFEFWMVRNPACPTPHLLSADQLFVDGVLQPFHHLPNQKEDAEAEAAAAAAAAQGVEEEDDGDELEPLSETEREAAPSPAAVAETATQPEPEKPTPSPASTCTSSTSGSKRWKDIFRMGEKKEKDKDKDKDKKKDRKKSSAELNINIWPFSRSRSAGTSSGGRTRAAVSAGRKASSAPCSRSNSTGESKSKLQMEVECRPLGLQLSLDENGRCSGAGVGRGRRWASSPGRPAGVYLGRSSPVRPVRRVGSVPKKIDRCSLVSEKKQRGGVGAMRVLNVNVPLCMGYGQHSGCSSVEEGSGGGGIGRGGSSRNNCGSTTTPTTTTTSHSSNPLFNLKAIFSKKVGLTNCGVMGQILESLGPPILVPEKENTMLGGTRKKTEGMDGLAIRGAIAVVLSLLVAIRAFKHGSLSKSGAFMGFLVLSIHIAASYSFGAIILVFFFTSSKLTKMGEDKKRGADDSFKVGGLCNWYIPRLFSIFSIFMLSCSCS